MGDNGETLSGLFSFVEHTVRLKRGSLQNTLHGLDGAHGTESRSNHGRYQRNFNFRLLQLGRIR